jgi:hypothetical protein
VSNKIIEVVPEARIEQFLQGRLDSVNYRPESARLIFSWTLDLFQGSHDDTALGMTEVQQLGVFQSERQQTRSFQPGTVRRYFLQHG